jgi:hypothetical protein
VCLFAHFYIHLQVEFQVEFELKVVVVVRVVVAEILVLAGGEKEEGRCKKDGCQSEK